MATYPEASDDIIVSADDLRAALTAIFGAAAMPPDDAALLAGSLVHADLRGVHSHGSLRVHDYVAKLLDGGVDPAGRPSMISCRGGAIVVDGGNAMGQIGGIYAMDRAIEAAAEHGVAFAALQNSNHCGAMDWYALRASARGMIGLCGTNALPTMAPVGGRDKIVGINPLGLALPAGRHADFVLDFAFGATAHGKIRVYHQKGLPIPEGWALDPEGRPTTDTAQALVGLIQPIGGHKGVALAMGIGMLATLLTKAGYGTRLGNMEDGATAGMDGQFFCALDVAAFTEPEAFRARVDAVIDEVHASARREGVERLYVPGEIETDTAERQAREGIRLTRETVSQIAAAAARLAVQVPSFAFPH